MFRKQHVNFKMFNEVMKTGNLIPMAPKTELQINKASQIRGPDMHRRLGRYRTCHEFSNWSELQYPSKFCEWHGV